MRHEPIQIIPAQNHYAVFSDQADTSIISVIAWGVTDTTVALAKRDGGGFNYERRVVGYVLARSGTVESAEELSDFIGYVCAADRNIATTKAAMLIQEGEQSDAV